MAVFSKKISGNIEFLAEAIDKAVMDKGITTKCAAKILNFESNIKTALLVYDKYFLRTGGRTTLCIMLTEEGRCNVRADVVSSGGASGLFTEHSYGADEKFLKIAESIINNL